MLELRWNPILKQWIIIATHRQNRTYKPPKDYCPLCPTKKGGLPTEVPTEDYDIVVFENKIGGFFCPQSLIYYNGIPLYCFHQQRRGWFTQACASFLLG